MEKKEIKRRGRASECKGRKGEKRWKERSPSFLLLVCFSSRSFFYLQFLTVFSLDYIFCNSLPFGDLPSILMLFLFVLASSHLRFVCQAYNFLSSAPSQFVHSLFPSKALHSLAFSPLTDSP